jgi:release factor glutamine methyltransferase
VNAEDLLDRAEKRLLDSPAIDHWQSGRERIEAEELLAHVLHDEDFDLEDEVSSAQQRRFERLVERRFDGEPVAFMTGFVEFLGLRLIAKPGVFVPRDSSEFLAEQAIRRLRRRPAPVHVDLATGSGPVALAVSSKVPNAEVYGCDLTGPAIALARANARSLVLPVRFLKGDLFGPLPRDVAGRVDVVTLHPPYLGRREVRTLPDEVLQFEPIESLTDQSPKGMGLIERTAEEAWNWLRPGGWLLVEVSPDRSRQVATALRRAGYADVRSTKGGVLKLTRVLTARAASG